MSKEAWHCGFIDGKLEAGSLEERPLKLLVVIASYGDRNIEFLRRIIRAYKNMSLDVDVVVVSNGPKDLGLEVEVVVGLPSNNPWSLPFAHKPILASRIEAYDLFAYSEDDMEITEANIRAFLEVTPQLEPDEIAGFLRYEVDSSGNRSLPEVHGNAHWKPESVRRRGDCVVAEFTNEHAAFYLLTQAQLKRAIASGGFLRDPCEGRYDMICTAATDPYTNCKMRKVICISALQDFLIHHAPNHYAGRLGLSLVLFEEQIQALLEICNNTLPVNSLFDMELNALQGKWPKCYYEKCREDLLALLPASGKTILSIGCGWGATELALQQRGVSVTVLPLDSVMGAIAARSGMKVVCGSLSEGLNKLTGSQFDAVIVSDLLHLLPDPSSLIAQCSALLQSHGVIVIGSPNFDYLPVLLKRKLGIGAYRKLRSFSEGGVHALSLLKVNRWMNEAGLQSDCLVWKFPQQDGPVSGSVAVLRGGTWFLKRAWQFVRDAAHYYERACDSKVKQRPWRSLGARLRPGRFMSEEWVVGAVKKR